MKYSEAIALARNPQSFDFRDAFIILENGTGKPIESQPNESRAQRAVDNLNDHEARNGRNTTYTFVSMEKENV